MGLDIRIPLGVMFTTLGLLLTGFGFSAIRRFTKRSLGIDVNLWWGLALLLFGTVMLFFGWRGAGRRAH